MDEDQIADVLKSERLGHDEPGMRGVYGHVSPGDAGRTDDRAPSPLGGLATSARRAPASVRGATAEPATANVRPGIGPVRSRLVLGRRKVSPGTLVHYLCSVDQPSKST